MDIIGLAGNLWQVNQNLLNSTLSLGGALFNVGFYAESLNMHSSENDGLNGFCA
jgi:hypothetical protein